MPAGVYEILNTLDGKRYIGSTVNLGKRWLDHRKCLRGGAHGNARLQRAWNKHGESAFKFLPILTCAPTKLMLMFYEQQLLDKAAPEYNILPNAWTVLGSKHSAEAKKRMSAAHIGKPVTPRTPEQNKAISIRMMGHSGAVFTHTPEARLKMRVARLGKKLGPLTAEHKANLSAALRGKKRGPQTAEHRAKNAAGHLGKKLGRPAANRGVPWSSARRAAQVKKTPEFTNPAFLCDTNEMPVDSKVESKQVDNRNST
ncbi:MAG: hypothetical protein DDT20_00688 [Firmicutes bacterium]|nr:hypothetical protein [Bacillota bacterium]